MNTGFASYREVFTARRSVVEAELELVNFKKQIDLSDIEPYRAPAAAGNCGAITALAGIN